MLKIKLFGARFSPNQLCIVCNHVLSGADIVEVAHDHDGVVQVFCEALDHPPADVSPVGIDHMADRLKKLKIKVPAGQYATRQGPGWTIRPI